MKRLSIALMLATLSASALALSVGQPAPPFTATDTGGRSVSLADYRGQHVVLEWLNPGCPFVRKHYGAKNMQATQKAAVERGVVWLAINSTSDGHGDYLSPSQLGAWMSAQGAAANATLMDDDGRIGRAYGARTTPHMYVIDPKGVLVYTGAIDDKPTANPADIAGATNLVNRALAESLAGQPVSRPATRAYGCTIKYSNNS